MRYHDIKKDDQLNGDGIRVTLFVSGCEHHCEECHNPETWNYNSGVVFDKNALRELRCELSKDYISGITLSGGDPLAPPNRSEILGIVKWVRANFPNKTIWLYTGYDFEALIFYGNYIISQIFKKVDVVVDRIYKKEFRDTSLKWRGSSNQRVIDVQKSLKQNKVILYKI